MKRESADFGRQLKALLKRNVLLKRREPIQTIFEIIVPICIYVAVCLAISEIRPKEPKVVLPPNSTIEYKTVKFDFNNTYKRPGPVLLVVNTKSNDKREYAYQVFKEQLGSGANVILASRANRPEIAQRSLKRHYLALRKEAANKENLPVGVVIDLDAFEEQIQQSANSNPFFSMMMGGRKMFGMYYYEIVLASVDLPPLPNDFSDNTQDSCMPKNLELPLTEVDPDDLSFDKCPALYYAETGFLHLQNAVHRTVLKVDGELSDSFSNKLSWRMFPRTAVSDVASRSTAAADLTKTWSSFTVYLAGIAVVQLFSALVAGAVTEKEKGVKETMLLMGMNGLAWKLSWFIVYFAEMIIVCVAATLITWLQSLLSGLASSVFFLMLFLYGFAMISFGLLLVSCFRKARSSATATSFMFVCMGLPFMMVKFATMFSKKAVPDYAHYLLGFLFPYAFQRGMDALIEGNRESLYNYKVSDMRVWGMVLMLILDGFLYLLIGLLIDYAPGIFHDIILDGKRKKMKEIELEMSATENPADLKNVESDPSLDNRKAIVIKKLNKTFNVRERGILKQYKAVDNLSLTIYGGQITCLLGHNGAGKTTLIRILTGSVKNYQGAVKIFNWEVQSNRDMEELRQDIGVCAQQNTLFDNLTCKEHLNFVLDLKHDVTAQERDATVAETMHTVSLHEKANTLGKNLSGGEKRKLCLAMALISKPRLLFLDEPTAGVDVYCRRQIWDVLTNYKQAGRVVLMTTHYMDEADMLSDRKALMHKGKLYAAGSSMFLRQRFDCGYRLTVEMDGSVDANNKEKVSNALKSVMPEIVQLESERSTSELIYALPASDENSDKLLSLLRFLESDQTQLASYGVKTYGWSIATLDEVFLKLEEEVAGNESDGANGAVPNKRPPIFRLFKYTKTDKDDNGEFVQENGKGKQKSGIVPISFDGIEKPAYSPNSFARHLAAILYLRLMQTIRNARVIMMKFLFPIVIAIVGMLLSRVLSDRILSLIKQAGSEENSNKTSLFVYQPFIYANVTTSIADMLKEKMMDSLSADEDSPMIEQIKGFTQSNGPFLLMTNATASNSMVAQSIQMVTGMFMTTPNQTELDLSRPLVELIQEYKSKIGAYYKIQESDITESTLMFSHRAIHALPTLLSYGHLIEASANGYFPMFMPALNTFSSASREVVIQAYISNLMFTLLFAMHVMTILPALGFDVVKDRETGCATQIKLAGISRLAYGFGSFIIDVFEYYVFLLVFLLFAHVFEVYAFSFIGATFAFLIYIAVAVPANVLLIHCIAQLIKTFRVFTSVVTLIASTCGFFPFLALFFWSMGDVIPTGNGNLNSPSTGLRYNSDWQTVITVFCFIFPPFNAAAAVFLIVFVSQPNMSTLETPQPETSDYFNDRSLKMMFFASIFHIILFSCILLLIEYETKIRAKIQMSGGWFGFLRKRMYLKSKLFANGNGHADFSQGRFDEDDDVTAERKDVFELASAPVLSEASAPFVHEVRKVYTAVCRDCKPVDSKVAVDNISFKLNYGQVFGLLGPNGAGKTSLIKMIIGEEDQTSGLIFSQDSTSLGYCPQDSVLWDQLSGEEHVFIYAYSRGFSQQQRQELVKRLSRGLGISQHMGKQSKRMSGGTKRKLCVALSLLGRPSALCLDEPSAGMDPGSKRFLWKVIKQIFANQKEQDWKIAALLTTHHLDEAENLCHRMGIMVNGQLRCIGSRQHLKSKYGKYYTLEVKLGSNQMDSGATGLIDFIDKLLPEPSTVRKSVGEHEAPQLINNFGRHYVFRIPSVRVESLAKIFNDLQESKQNGHFESYSFSQVTLEQIFIQFAKEQYEDDL